MAESIQEEVSPELMARSQAGNMARMVLDAIDVWLSKHEETTISRVMKSIQHEGGSLNPDGAVQAWFEIHAARRLRADLEKAVQQGNRAASKLQPVSAS